MTLLLHSRIFIALVVGCAVGILGFTGLTGFLFFPVSQLGASLVVWMGAKARYNRYFKTWRQFVLEGLTSELLTYILAWTVLYNVVHVY